MTTLVRSVLLLLACTAAACVGSAPGPSDDGDDFTDPSDDGSEDGDDTGGDDTGDGTGDDGGGDTGDTGDDSPVDPGECESEVIEAPAGIACAAATQTCIEACKDDTCWDACVNADPDPEGCGTCLEDGFLACANSRGCQEAWDAMICCYDQCADPESAECESSCIAESGAYDTCAVPHEEACSTEADTLCFGA
jgi:hypothetical protein